MSNYSVLLKSIPVVLLATTALIPAACIQPYEPDNLSEDDIPEEDIPEEDTERDTDDDTIQLGDGSLVIEIDFFDDYEDAGYEDCVATYLMARTSDSAAPCTMCEDTAVFQLSFLSDTCGVDGGDLGTLDGAEMFFGIHTEDQMMYVWSPSEWSAWELDDFGANHASIIWGYVDKECCSEEYTWTLRW